ncbi:hypothetical protein CARUB_v10007553mg [Capsella rubella]|uniref:TF-B3 domain-containing protein n=1 Tax=Capsella rubella TaxID=81985 RepID=R0H2N7_9BRAS|nr:hypothetical protein CARUB_v10007553mg [Capsella rubella]
MADPVLQSPENPHFFKVLLPGFDSNLNIPMKFFSAYIEGRYEGKTVELESDASEKSWKVEMEGRRLTFGWKEFASSHDLRIGDVIIFRHQGALLFHVACFGPSCCEIQYRQSCNDDDHLYDDQENLSKLSSVHGIHILFFPKKFATSGALIKGSNNIVLMNEVAKKWRLILKFRESSRTFYMRDGWRSFCHENGLKPGDAVTFELESNNLKTPLLRFSTAEFTSVSTKDCNKLGKINKSGDSQKVSSSSSVTHLPKNFVKVNRMENLARRKITLLDKHGKDWAVTLVRERRNTQTRLGFGLKDFFKANGTKANESLVFELVWEDKTTLPLLRFCSNAKTYSKLRPSY